MKKTFKHVKRSLRKQNTEHWLHANGTWYALGIKSGSKNMEVILYFYINVWWLFSKSYILCRATLWPDGISAKALSMALPFQLTGCSWQLLEEMVCIFWFCLSYEVIFEYLQLVGLVANIYSGKFWQDTLESLISRQNSLCQVEKAILALSCAVHGGKF